MPHSANNLTRDDLNEMARKAETGEQWAEVCRLEAEIEGGPFFVSAPVNATMEMAEAGAAISGLSLSAVASVYRAMIEVRS